MTSAFDHPLDARCSCAVCGYHRQEDLGARANPPPSETTTDAAPAEPTAPALEKLRLRQLGRRPNGTINPRTPLTRDEKRAAALLVAPDDVERPRTRGDCVDGPRPCPWVSCRYHLYLDVGMDGALKLNHLEREVWEMDESCTLDVADRGGETLDHVGQILGVTRERVRQIEARALRVMGRRHPKLEAA